MPFSMSVTLLSNRLFRSRSETTSDSRDSRSCFLRSLLFCADARLRAWRATRRALRAGSSGSPRLLFCLDKGVGDGVVAVVMCEDEDASEAVGEAGDNIV